MDTATPTLDKINKLTIVSMGIDFKYSENKCKGKWQQKLYFPNLKEY
jgi:hypothetical protein